MNKSFREIMRDACQKPAVETTEKLTIGLGDYATPETIAEKFKVPVEDILKQLEMGISVEGEHTTDPEIAREIAMDHLTEAPDYYSKLADMEKTFEDSSEELSEAVFHIMSEGKSDKSISTVPFSFETVESAAKFKKEYCLDESNDYYIVSKDAENNIVDMYGDDGATEEQPEQSATIDAIPGAGVPEVTVEPEDPFYKDLQDIMGFGDEWEVTTENSGSAFELQLKNGDTTVELCLTKLGYSTDSKFMMKTIIKYKGEIQEEKTADFDLPILFKNILADETICQFFKDSMPEKEQPTEISDESIIAEAGETSGLVVLSDGSRRKIYTDKEAFHPRLLTIGDKTRDLYQDGGQWYRVLNRAIKSNAVAIIPAQYFRPHDTTGVRVYITVDEYKKDLKNPSDYDKFRIENWKGIYTILKDNQIYNTPASVSIDKLTLDGFEALYQYLTGSPMNLLYKYTIKTTPDKKISFNASNAAEIAAEIRDLIPAYLSSKQISGAQDNLENHIKDSIRREIEKTAEYKEIKPGAVFTGNQSTIKGTGKKK